MAYNSKTGGDEMKEAAALPRGGRHRAPLQPLPAMDLPFLVLVLTLVGFGLVMLGSASGAVALYRRGDAFAYLRPQLLYAAMGIAGLWLASRVDYHIFHKLAWPLLGISLVLLVVVLFMPEYNGCKRWLVLPGVGTLQPSEIAKFAVVLVFSHIISLNHDRMRSFAVGVLPFVLVLGVVAALMLLEPHLSGTLLILGIGAVLMFVGGTGLRWFVLAGLGGAAAIGAAVVVMPDLVPYAADRLRCRQQDDPAGLGHADHSGLVVLVEQLFDGKHLRLCPLDDLPDAGIDLVQPLLKRHPGIGAHGPEIHRCKPVARIVQNAPAHNGVTRVDAQNSHSAIPFLL